ncbi:CLUMA_CG010802, isoform A [Clunio marinus]|uniref:CLUMA_CG010802, isoform A n=1 Tax=Clunio marinus TaxID=568069 RepID=A0A1J1IAU9_9DIPT|nr:CLUMA_CG010802, isoform A [Clunio marinus]
MGWAHEMLLLPFADKTSNQANAPHPVSVDMSINLIVDVIQAPNHLSSTTIYIRFKYDDDKHGRLAGSRCRPYSSLLSIIISPTIVAIFSFFAETLNDFGRICTEH